VALVAPGTRTRLRAPRGTGQGRAAGTRGGGPERPKRLDVQCLALWDLAEVLAAAKRLDEAAGALEQALDRCRRKKNLALATRVLARLEALKADLTAVPATDP